MTEGKREIIRGLLEEYDIESAQDRLIGCSQGSEPKVEQNVRRIFRI